MMDIKYFLQSLFLKRTWQGLPDFDEPWIIRWKSGIVSCQGRMSCRVLNNT